MSRYYTLDEETYPRFLHDDRTEMDLLAFIHVADPTKVRIVEKERAEGEAKLLDSTIGRMVPLLPVALARAKSELEASVEKLFDEGGSTEQVDSAAEIKFVTAAEDTATGSVAAERPKRPRKKRSAATNASGSSHPPKKLRGDYGTSSEVVIGAIPSLPFVTSSVSATPGREDGAPLGFVTGANLRTIGSAVRSVVPLLVTTEAVITTSVAHVSPVPVPRVAD
ncbi:hypothetical protein Tco_1579818, partial [Tanacetum coccineum]